MRDPPQARPSVTPATIAPPASPTLAPSARPTDPGVSLPERATRPSSSTAPAEAPSEEAARGGRHDDHTPAHGGDRGRNVLMAQPRSANRPDAAGSRLLSDGGGDRGLGREQQRRTRVSPIVEELKGSSPAGLEVESAKLPPPSAVSSASTKTLRGGASAALPSTPAPSSVRTPSYPFPPMRMPRSQPAGFHRPFTALSPTVAPTSGMPPAGREALRDRPASSLDARSAATATFSPPASAGPDDLSPYPAPNLYEATLALASEPGLDPWWTNVVHLMRDHFGADRVTLSVPADASDPENVPWGLKATFDAGEEDADSLAYLRRSSQDFGSDGSEPSTMEPTEPQRPAGKVSPPRPRLEGRHSFSGFEASQAPAARPGMRRAESHLLPHQQRRPPTSPAGAQLNPATLERQDAYERAHPPQHPDLPLVNERRFRGRVVPVLQALDYEADPLIDCAGVTRVLERAKTVTLRRQYSDPGSRASSSCRARPDGDEDDAPPRHVSTGAGDVEKAEAERSSSRITTDMAGRGPRGARGAGPARSGDAPIEAAAAAAVTPGAEPAAPPSPAYEEFEQFPASPWSQSPAPSPAPRPEPAENPFFAEPRLDEASFEPQPTPESYAAHCQVEAIGLEQGQTVVHVPLVHPLLSRRVRPGRSDPAWDTPGTAAASHDFAEPRRGSAAGVDGTAAKKTPIAILSILSPLIPYPSNLSRALDLLGPHLATSYSLARHHSNLENEAAVLSRRRLRDSDAVGRAGATSDGQQLEDLENLDVAYSPGIEDSRVSAANGSITSPSEYSSLSLSSPLGSFAGTPGRDSSIVGLWSERHSGANPSGSEAVDGYFQSRRRAVRRLSSGTLPTLGQSSPGARKGSGDSAGDRQQLSPPGRGGRRRPSPDPQQHRDAREDPAPAAAAAKPPQVRLARASPSSSDAPVQGERRAGPRQAEHGGPGAARAHSLLHSFGADFNATFQSLPAATTAVSRASAPARAHSRSASDAVSPQYVMPPPSERLLRTIVDSIPVHIFTAAPQNGTITWVNSRFLIYRGQSVEDFMRDPWHSLHPDQRDDYLAAWRRSLRDGEHFSYQVRVRRFDGSYRWFYVRAAPLRDTRGVTVHWFGTTMDIHEQHVAEANAARQQETAASEAKYRSLANSSPQIVFAATDAEGITFANTRWLSYSGQRFVDALGFGFLEHVHADDLAKCRLPAFGDAAADPGPAPAPAGRAPSPPASATSRSENASSTGATVTGARRRPSRVSSDGSSGADGGGPELSELARAGVLKVSRDGDGKPSYSAEVRLRSKDGDFRWHLVRCLMVDSTKPGGGEGSWFGTCTDINDQKLLEQTMKETMDSKTRFLSNMSHEIRTPLIGISGMVEFLFDTVLNAEQSDYCNTIKSSSDGLLSIVNDILDLSKIEAGMMSLSYQWFHIRSLIESVNDAVSSVAINKRLELNYVVEEDVPATVKGDRARLRQILMNVLGNAVKFTNEGEVFAHCQVYRGAAADALGDDEIMIAFEVVDSGQGFTEKEAELIFKPFSQVDGSSTRQHGGSGLGLVISRQLVELHGGEMTGTSEPGRGSTFRFHARFRLPSDADHPAAEPPRRRRRASSAPRVKEPVRSPARQPGGPLLAKVLTQSPAASAPLPLPLPPPPPDRDDGSPGVASSASSDPSIRSPRTIPSVRSSVSSTRPDSFSSAKDAPAGPAAGMALRLPGDGPKSAQSTPTPAATPGDGSAPGPPTPFHPPMYSILVVCPQPYSLRAITRHIEMTLPEDIPHQVTARGDLEECRKLMGGDDPVIFTHIVVNLGEAADVVAFMDGVPRSVRHPQTSMVILADSKMRNEIKKLASGLDYDRLEADGRVRFLHKPVKPSRFAEVFDPAREREPSAGRTRSSAAERRAERQKQVFVDMERDMGHKGHRVLLVEDNPVNQKVLLKFLHKVGMDVDCALDGSIGTDKVFAQDHSYYSIILCDLHMPNKDGYQTCKEIRRWERKQRHPHLPIIALSANVMADVLDKCVEAGFSSYVTKPVDFKALSKTMTDLMEPSRPRELMRHRT